MVVAGQTQESGKTTTLEALISRSGLPAIAFLTKRGEGSMDGRHILPYFRERADWPFVESVLESTMKEKKKFERAWIVKACRGAHTLADVLDNVRELQSKAKRGLDQDMYMLLGEYLERVVPLIARLPKAGSVDLGAGVAVMDLIAYPEELQMLVIASTLEWIHKHSDGVITLIPEAWKFIPEGKNTPAKVIAEKLAREGAGLKNYLWIDSQDLAGVAKMPLRAAAVWLIGVQREANEIERNLDNMPAGLKKPKGADIATLELGQFYACHGKHLTRTYVQPAWMDEEVARQVAVGRLSVSDVVKVQAQVPDFFAKGRPLAALAEDIAPESSGAVRSPSPVTEPHGAAQTPAPAQTFAAGSEEEDVRQFTENQLMEAVAKTTIGVGEVETARRIVRALLPVLNGGAPDPAGALPEASSQGACSPHFTEAASAAESNGADAAAWPLVKRVVELIRHDPLLIRLALERPQLDVKINRQVVSVDGNTIKGRIATLIHEGWIKPGGLVAFGDLRKELHRRGLDPSTPQVRISAALRDYVDIGLFWRGPEDGTFQLAPGAQSRVVQS